MKRIRTWQQALFLFLTIFITVQPCFAMDEEEIEEYTALGQMGMFIGTTIAGMSLAWLIKKCCTKPKDSQPVRQNRHRTFAEWKEDCAKLPKFNKNFHHTALTIDELTSAVELFAYQTCRHGSLINDQLWLGNMPSKEDLITSFTPYIQKLDIKPHSIVAFHGDLHGDIHALNNFIQNLNNKGHMHDFKITDQDFYMIFLGDYTDRGYYGAEVWYTILRLKTANPDHVFMVRGNHEDETMNYKDGFLAELQKKFSVDNNYQFKKLFSLYNLLPVALFLGSGTEESKDYLLCCHGGLELGFDAQNLLQTPQNLAYTLLLNEEKKLDRAPGIEKLPIDIQNAVKNTIPKSNQSTAIYDAAKKICKTESYQFEGASYHTSNHIGFMWNDFSLDPKKTVDYIPGRGWQCGKELTKANLENQSSSTHKIRGIFRAHQHGEEEMMKRILGLDGQGSKEDAGIGKLWTDHPDIKKTGKLWDGIVCTFLVAPAFYGSHGTVPFDYDAFGLLKTAPTFDQWHLKSIRISERDNAPLKNLSSSSFAASSSLSFAASSSSSSQQDFYQEIGQ